MLFASFCRLLRKMSACCSQIRFCPAPVPGSADMSLRAASRVVEFSPPATSASVTLAPR
jgi:hypothetical protein